MSIAIMLTAIPSTIFAKPSGSISEDGEVLHIDFNEESAMDSSGGGNDGIIVGNPEFVEGIDGKAIHIVNDKTGSQGVTAEQYVNFGQPEDMKFGSDDFSISLWYKNNSTSESVASLLSNKDWNNAANTGFTIASFTNDVRLNFTAEGMGRKDILSVYANDKKWHNIVMTVNRKGNAIAYLDGKEVGKVDISASVGKSIDFDDFVLGADGMKNYGINDAIMDDLIVYKQVISQNKIAELHACGALKLKIVEMETLIANGNANPEATPERIATFKAAVQSVKERAASKDTVILLGLLAELNAAEEAYFKWQDPLISFQVISDPHIQGNNSTSTNSANLIDALQDINGFDPTSSAVIFPGDITDTGSEAQFDGFYDIVDSYLPTPETMIALGNHDVRWQSGGWAEAKERYMRHNQNYMPETNNRTYFDKWIDGYHFITLNTENDLKDEAFITDEQITWLKKTMADGAEEGKPIFLILHQPLKDTFPNSTEWSVGDKDAELKEILAQYPQSVLFSGHLHNGMDVTSVFANGFGTQVDLPSFYYNDVGLKRGQIGYQINVYKGKIKIKPRDFLNDRWMSEYDMEISKDAQAAGNDEQDLDFTKMHASTGTFQTGEPIEHAIDGDITTIWHSKYGGSPREDHYMILDLGKEQIIDGFRYLPRQDGGTNGIVTKYKMEVSSDGGKTYQEVIQGRWSETSAWKRISFQKTLATHIKFTSLESVTNGNDLSSAAEIRVTGLKTDALHKGIEAVNAMDETKYTILSWAEVVKSKNLAMALMKDITATQDVIDQAIHGINLAIAQLKEKDSTLAKSILKSAIDKAIAAEASTEFETLAPSVKALIISMRTAAQAVYADAAATNAQCSDAWLNLANALQYLDFQADKAALLSLINECKDINLDDYTIGVEEFKAALANAQSVYNNANALQASIDAAVARLQAAKDGLKNEPVDKSLLAIMITGIEGHVGNGDNYNKESSTWADFVKALADAKAILANEAATQAEVDAAVSALSDAYTKIRLLPSEEQLAELNGFLNKVKGINRRNFTSAQLAVIDETTEKVKSMINNFDADQFATTQKAMVVALNMIDDVTAQAPSKPGKPDTSGNANAAQPNTGDNTNIAALAFAILVSGCGVVMMLRKRSKKAN